MQTSSFVLQDGSHDFTVYLVLKAGGSQNQYADVFDNNHGGSNATAAGPVMQQNSNDLNQMTLGWWSGSTYTGSSTFSVSSTDFQLHENRKSGATATHAIDGTEVVNTTVVATIAQDPPVPLAVGSNTYVPGREWSGDLAEFIYFNRPLTTAERATVTAYLATKYALTVP